MGIVIELQKEALDESISIESLMRKAYLVARKLNLKDFEEWISQEQNGYKQEVPEYRNIGGEIKAWNPYHGWIPMVLSADITDLVSKMPIPTSISELQDIYNSSEGTVCLSINGTLTEWFNSNTDSIPTKYRFFSTKSELYRIMSTVRNKILDWALLLEENGIVGEGMTFTGVEKEKAQNNQVINHYTNNFYAEVSDIDVKQGE
ncbi:Uncharacterised protein [uncultured Roseburia sp.]|uniref:AbiTii domain-containing protein n=1 Tax=Brotonthovivens ammoniilytica TaxID=2981725 RepID=A0ABT2TH01_9FIRM|nr:hypothetical protein [Brotonthovivens ammoniilytica]MCU6761470.1 hypothetical protein [Brotonthovivens ammoniilytica]SCI29423.1 Uncharacterised protein [uncultured Roseburia sp.]